MMIPISLSLKWALNALIEILKRLILMNCLMILRHKANTETSKQRKTEALKRLQVVEALRDLKIIEINPEWMIMKVVPVIPPELRPLFHLMVVVLQLQI